jgi:hypothetical protein
MRYDLDPYLQEGIWSNGRAHTATAVGRHTRTKRVGFVVLVWGGHSCPPLLQLTFARDLG